MLAVWMWSGNTTQASNILINPSFEADGNHGSGVPITGWIGNPGGPWYINTDQFAHSGNNYYKVWGAFNGSVNYQAVYQDNSSLPSSTYQADGWMYTSPSDVMWSGDDADYAWLEVSFRDASNNILALYKSDTFSDTLGSFPYTTGVWYNFPITNICQTNPPYSVIGSTNVLVAPPGTVKVRFQHTLYQLLYGGGSCYFDDATLNQTGGPVPPQITQIYPNNLLFASNHISFHVTSASSTPISNSNIHLVVNGTDVSSGCTFSGSSPNITVTYNGLAANVWAYNASITVTDAYAFTASATMNFDTLTPTFVWEAEDYDFTNSLYYDSPTLSSTPAANSYFGVTGTTNVDYFKPGGASGPHVYRPNDPTGTSIAGETPRQKFLTAQQTDPGVQDYEVGYINTGDWMNYTRDYPAGTYTIYARLAGGAGATTISLDDVTTPGVTNNLGVFTFNGTDWGSYNYIGLQDTNGNLLSVTLSGKKTLRVTLLGGGDNMNFFMLMPAQVGLPFLSNISPANGTVFATNQAFTFTASSTSGINNSGVHLRLNGADVSSSLVISGSGTLNVSFPSLQSNTMYTAVISVTNTGGAGVSRTIQFDTMRTDNFYVKIEDFDFNGGSYDTDGNGLIPNAYQGDALPGDTGAISNVDYFHQDSDGGSYLYRGPAALATEVTADIPLPGYFAGSDYDVGNFNGGNWGNFTRNYPPGKYYVFGRLAGYAMNTTLSQVTGGLGTTTQTLNLLGTWTANPGGWQNWQWVQLQNNGLPVVVSVGGVKTLRVTSAGNCNANYFMLVPVQSIHVSAAHSGGNIAISFPTTAGSAYRVFYTSSLTSGGWTLLATVPGTGTVQTVNDATSGGSMRFYKVTSP